MALHMNLVFLCLLSNSSKHIILNKYKNENNSKILIKKQI